MRTTNTPVLVVGAGPVGAVLALELARHRVASMVVERSVRMRCVRDDRHAAILANRPG